MTATFAPTAWIDIEPIDLRTRPPADLQTSINSLLEAFASPSPDATRYLPDEFLTILLS